MAYRKALSVRRVWSPTPTGRKVFRKNYDTQAGRGVAAEGFAEVLCHVPQVWERFSFACHTCLQCRPISAFGKRQDTQKHADKEVRGRRPQHLSGVHRFLQLQGETAQDAAQTQEGGVCATVRALKELINNS